MINSVAGRVLGKEYGPDSGGRQKNVTIVKPILIGCTSKRLPNAIPNPYPGAPNQVLQDHSHTWTLYVRPYNNEDISVWIKKVQFKLHDSYPNSIRSCSVVPFEVEETGWGEFEVQVKIFFVDPNERQVGISEFAGLTLLVTEYRELQVKFVTPPIAYCCLTPLIRCTKRMHAHVFCSIVTNNVVTTVDIKNVLL